MAMPKREPSKVVRVPLVLSNLLVCISNEYKQGNVQLVEDIKKRVAQDTKRIITSSS